MEDQCHWLPYVEGNQPLKKVLEQQDARGVIEARLIDAQGNVLGYQFKVYLGSNVDTTALRRFDADPKKVSHFNLEGNVYRQFSFTINKEGLKPAQFIVCSRVEPSQNSALPSFFNYR